MLTAAPLLTPWQAESAARASGGAAGEASPANEGEASASAAVAEVSDDEESEGCTLFVKNLNFKVRQSL